ncbi:MAG: DUF6111 family protein, partial [Beijerinckiaceae bacterium]|nr:DUF6111 family protein [Beijerinckiaceae bacterium]
MGRSISELALLYLIPFAAYFLYLMLRRVYILSFDHWTRRVVATLSLSGLAFVLIGLLATGFFAERHEGAYQPAHIENG